METDREYILAHDLGTSANKATLFDREGRMVASARRTYDTAYTRPGWVEQDPESWWTAVRRTTAELLELNDVKPAEIACVALSGHMMGCVLVNADGAVLRPAIIRADTRAAEQERYMTGAVGMEAGYLITGHRLSASYTAAKLLWVRDNEPWAYGAAARVLNSKDFIVHRLTGAFVTDYSDASGTDLYDLQKKCWSDELIRAFDINPSLMPELRASTDVVGKVTPGAAEACGLLAGTPVVAGGGDGACACVGAGAVSAGDVCGSLGPSSWISSIADEPLLDPGMRVCNWAHMDPRLYAPCGTMQAAGLSTQWFADVLAGGVAVDRVNELAATSPPGSNGLIYLPYLLGERSPRWDMEARGAYVGLSATTSQADMARAVVEGVGLNLRLIIDCLGIPAGGSVTMIGTGAESDLWMGAFSDIWQREVLLPEYLSEAAPLGAALAGGVGVGFYDGFDAINWMNPTRRKLIPHARRAGLYNALLPIFNLAYEGLRAANAALAAPR